MFCALILFHFICLLFVLACCSCHCYLLFKYHLLSLLHILSLSVSAVRSQLSTSCSRPTYFFYIKTTLLVCRFAIYTHLHLQRLRCRNQLYSSIDHVICCDMIFLPFFFFEINICSFTLAKEKKCLIMMLRMMMITL